MALTKTNLQGLYLTVAGAPQVGRVGFVPNVDVVIPPENVLLPIDIEWAYLDSEGVFDIDLVPTDHAGSSPAGWSYTVWEQIEGAKPRNYQILLPASGSTTQLADIAPGAPAPPEVGYILASTLTTKGDILVRDATGVTRLPVGTNDYLLSSNSAEATGLKWIPAPSGGGAVSSVNGQTGAVVLGANDVGASASGHNHDASYSVLAHNHNANYEALGAVSTHAAAPDPHPQYTTPADWVDPLALRYGGFALSSDPSFHQGSGSFSNNTVVWVEVDVPAGQPIAEVYFGVRNGAVSHDGTNNGNRIAIYEANGTLAGQTAIDETLWTNGGWRGGAISGGSIAAQSTRRLVYALGLVRGITAAISVQPQASDANSGFVTLGPGASIRRGGYALGVSSLPASGAFDRTTFGTLAAFHPVVLLK